MKYTRIFCEVNGETREFKTDDILLEKKPQEKGIKLITNQGMLL
jgi:hypothetical protein